MTANATERIARFIATTRYEDIPERVLRKARYQIANTLASIPASAHTSAAQAVLAAARKWNKPGPCTVLPSGERLALHEAVFVNAALSMALDRERRSIHDRIAGTLVLAGRAESPLTLGELERRESARPRSPGPPA